MLAMGPRWDIFCKVVDNFGDIGVAWRLARMLANEHGLAVRLWVDDVAALARIWPSVAANANEQQVSGVDVRRWREPFPAADPAEVVIETFQCALPHNYLVAMAARPKAPCWINLDYLSAEPWVEGCHALPSPHPRLPLTKHFYFPGFTPATGGLLREQGLEASRAAFVGDREALRAYWADRGLDMPASGEIRVSLFCYPQAPLDELFDVWAQGSTPVTAFLPEGQAATRLRAALAAGGNPPDWIERGQARLRIVPFTDQDAYDRLLWACDVNFVRGEDSFVRAQWARRPFVWNIYPQAENAHWIKLHAFLDRFAPGLDPAAEQALRQFWRVWNGIVNPSELAWAWEHFVAHRADFARHGEDWANERARGPELAAGLVEFCADVGQSPVI
jgi:uncharacterized repeat protein (TIGR03837 family)